MTRFINFISLLLVAFNSFSQHAALYVENPATFLNKNQSIFLEEYVTPRFLVPDSIKNSCENRFVDIMFSVDTTGDIDIIEISRSYNKEIDKEICSIIKSSSGLWQPATQDGRKLEQAILLRVPISKIERNCPEYIILVEESNNHYLKGNYVESVRISNRILELFPNDTDALMLRAKCKIQLREFDSACILRYS
jgi:hypothetical protein